MKTEPRQLILLSWVTLQLQANSLFNFLDRTLLHRSYEFHTVLHQVWRVKRLRSRMTP